MVRMGGESKGEREERKERSREDGRKGERMEGRDKRKEDRGWMDGSRGMESKRKEVFMYTIFNYLLRSK